jgi:hypothetical protein
MEEHVDLHSETGNPLMEDCGKLMLGGGVNSNEGERLHFVLPSFPPSVNRLHKIDHVRRLVTLSDEVLLWKTRIVPFIKPCRWAPSGLLKLVLEYESPDWICKNGNLRRKDSHNLDKIVIDSLFSKWGWDDSRLAELVSRKRYGLREQIQVTLERVDAELRGDGNDSRND